MISALIGIKEISERVENKNFLTIAGKPLFFWIISTLIKTEEIDEIVLNIDGENLIQLINKEFTKIKKLKIISREENIKGHDVSMNLIIERTLSHCKNDYILNTHTTNPFIKNSTFSKAIESYFKYQRPIFSTLEMKNRFYNTSNQPINHDLDNLIPTQDLDPIYLETSTFYIFSKDQFNMNKNRISKDSIKFPISKIESVDIDDYEDLEIVKLLENRLLNE